MEPLPGPTDPPLATDPPRNPSPLPPDLCVCGVAYSASAGLAVPHLKHAGLDANTTPHPLGQCQSPGRMFPGVDAGAVGARGGRLGVEIPPAAAVDPAGDAP